METYELSTCNTRKVLHDQLRTTDFKDEIDLKPYRQFNHKGDRVSSNLMSGDWAWKEAVRCLLFYYGVSHTDHLQDIISQDPSTHGAMLVPIVAGSDKTTVSVATGHQEYHPVYMSPGNVTNTARRGHSNSVIPVAFLPIPKSMSTKCSCQSLTKYILNTLASKQQAKCLEFQRFVRQVYHMCLARIFTPLRQGMTRPEVVLCPDGHFRRAIYSLGPYIADYPEQVWLAGIVQGWCPK